MPILPAGCTAPRPLPGVWEIVARTGVPHARREAQAQEREDEEVKFTEVEHAELAEGVESLANEHVRLHGGDAEDVSRVLEMIVGANAGSEVIPHARDALSVEAPVITGLSLPLEDTWREVTVGAIVDWILGPRVPEHEDGPYRDPATGMSNEELEMLQRYNQRVREVGKPLSQVAGRVPTSGEWKELILEERIQRRDLRGG